MALEREETAEVPKEGANAAAEAAEATRRSVRSMASAGGGPIP